MPKTIVCKKCGKTWYRYFKIPASRVPYYCPWCEGDKLKTIPPVRFVVKESIKNK